MTFRNNPIVVVKVVDLNTSHIYSHTYGWNGQDFF